MLGKISRSWLWARAVSIDLQLLSLLCTT